MADETPTPTITDELSKMGKLVAQAIQSAWASDERKKLEAEVVDGLRKFGDEFSSAAKKAGDSETAKQIKTQAEKVAADMQQRDIAGDIRKGLISGLEIINQELSKLVERLEPAKAPEEAVAAAAAAPETAADSVAAAVTEGGADAEAAPPADEPAAGEPAAEPETPAA
jgi:phage-related protein